MNGTIAAPVIAWRDVYDWLMQQNKRMDWESMAVVHHLEQLSIAYQKTTGLRDGLPAESQTEAPASLCLRLH